MLSPVPVAVLVSGGGSNLQALLDAQAAGKLHSGAIRLVVSDRAGAYALERAAMAGVEAVCLSGKGRKLQDWEEELLELLKARGIRLVVLAGFLTILSARMIAAYRGRILNVHPSLIPAFCGQGFYGLKVHEAALERGVKLTGATVHLVNEEADGGPILLQKTVRVRKGDSPETLQKRVMEQAEWLLLPRACEMLCKTMIREAQARPLEGEAHG